MSFRTFVPAHALVFLLSAISLQAADKLSRPAPITVDSVVAEINRYRSRHDLPPLSNDSRLCLAADDRMRDMIEQEYWSHQSPEGQPPFIWLHPRGYSFRVVGENLARGFETTEVLVSSWMDSRGHRENILSPDFSDIGIAVLDGSVTGRAAGKSVVVLFAREQD